MRGRSCSWPMCRMRCPLGRNSEGLLVSYPLAQRLGALALAAGAGLGLVAAYLGQRALDRAPLRAVEWALLLGGAAAFALCCRGQALERAREQPAQAVRQPKLSLVALAVLVAGAAFPGFAGNRFRLLPTVLWVAALACLYVAYAGRDESRLPAWRTIRGKAAGGVRVSWEMLLVAGIVLVGAFLRLYRLDAIPAEMGTDMPLKYENAREILQGQFMIFCPRYPGRESLLFYLIALYGRLFGLGFFAIKFTTAILGVATIPALYVLARELYGRRVAAAAAALLALSRWHVTLSRTGYRAILVPLFLAVLMLLLVRALRRASGPGFVTAGLVLWLGMYTYNSFLVVPLTLGLVLVLEMALSGSGWLRRYSWGLIGMALAAVLVFLPLGHYILEQPQVYAFRVATRLTDAEVPLPAQPWRVLAGNLGRAAGMFNLKGDVVAYTNVPNKRHLGAVSGVLFAAGVAYALVRWRRGHNAMVLAFLGAMTLPTALALAFPNEVPNAGRASGVLASTYLLAAVPLVALYRQAAALQLPDWLRREPGRLMGGWRRVAGVLPAVVLIALLGAELRETWQGYFEEYVRHLPGGNYAISLEIARVLDDFEGEGESYVVVWPYWFDGNALRAQLRVKPRTWDWEVPRLDPNEPPLSTVRGKVLFIVHPSDTETLVMLRECFPRGVAIGHRDNNGQMAFVTFYGER